MDTEEKTDNEKRFQEEDFLFPFRKFRKMAEMMRSCCAGEGMVGCCSMMKKMMQYGEGHEMGKKKKDTGETG